MLGLICPELGVAPLVDPGTDVEDERPTPVGSPSPVEDGTVPLPAQSGIDILGTDFLGGRCSAGDGDPRCGA